LARAASPLLDHAENYYLQPMDLLPEMTLGLAVFLDWDLDYPARFLRRLIGPGVAQKLDAIAIQAMQDVAARLGEMWSQLSHPA